MQNNEDLNAKTRILEAAKEIFSAKGFEGTSTRDIAGLANVNLASLHYYFQSKQHLYFEVVRSLFKDAQKKISDIFNEKPWNAGDFALAIFDMFLSQERVVMEKFKLIMQGAVNNLKPMGDMDIERDSYGPLAPVLRECIVREYGGSIDEGDRLWGVRVIVSFIELNAMRYHLTSDTQFAIEKSSLMNDLKRLVNVVLKEIVRTK